MNCTNKTSGYYSIVIKEATCASKITEGIMVCKNESIQCVNGGSNLRGAGVVDFKF